MTRGKHLAACHAHSAGILAQSWLWVLGLRPQETLVPHIHTEPWLGPWLRTLSPVALFPAAPWDHLGSFKEHRCPSSLPERVWCNSLGMQPGHQNLWKLPGDPKVQPRLNGTALSQGVDLNAPPPPPHLFPKNERRSDNLSDTLDSLSDQLLFLFLIWFDKHLLSIYLCSWHTVKIKHCSCPPTAWCLGDHILLRLRGPWEKLGGEYLTQIAGWVGKEGGYRIRPKLWLEKLSSSWPSRDVERRRVTQVAGRVWCVKHQGERDKMRRGITYRQVCETGGQRAGVEDSRSFTAMPRPLAFTLLALGSHGRL